MKFILKVFSFIFLCAFAAVPAAGQEAAETIDLGEVVITAQRTPSLLKDTAATVTVIDRDEIEKSGAVKLGDVLREAAGIQIIQYGSLGSSISMAIRGANSTQVLVLVDGRPINLPSTGMADLSWIPVESIERIEIMQTPAASLYGANAVGGVVQIFTREPSQEQSAQWSASAGGFGTRTGSLIVEQPLTAGSARLGAVFESTTGDRGNSAHHAADGDAAFIFNITDNRKIRLKLSSHNDRTGLPGPKPPANIADRTATQLLYGDDEISSRLDNQRFRSGAFQMDADLLKKENSALSLKFYRDENKLFFHQEYLVFNFGDNANHVNLRNAKYSTDNYGGDLQYEKSAGTNKLVAGFNFRHERFATKDILRDENAGTSTIQNWINDSTNRALFIEDEWKASPRWVLSMGSRWDRHAVYGGQFSPHFSALRRGSTTTRFSVTRAYRAPSMNDLFWPEDAFSRGNPQLTPEKALSFEAGFEKPIGDKVDANLNIFSRRTRDMIAWAPTGPDAGFGPKWQPSNLNTQRTRGAEIRVSARLSGEVTATVTDTFLDSRQETMDVVDGVTNAMVPFERTAIFTPKNSLKTSLEFKKGKFSFKLDGSYVSRTYNYYSNYNAFPAVTMDTKSIPARAVFGCNFTWRLPRQYKIRFSVDNIFDRSYVERFGYVVTDGDYPMPGRNFTLWLGKEI